MLYLFEETRKALYDGAAKAISAIPNFKPYKLQLPVKCKMQYRDLDPKLTKPELVTKEWVSDDGRKLHHLYDILLLAETVLVTTGRNRRLTSS